MSGRIITDSNIVTAIAKYIRLTETTAKALAEEIGVSSPALCKWRRVGSGIKQEQWQLLFPIIKPYLPQDEIYKDENGNDAYTSKNQGLTGQYYFDPKCVPLVVPVFNDDNISDFRPSVETPDQYALRMGILDKAEYKARSLALRMPNVLCFRNITAIDGFQGETEFYACPSLARQNGGLCLIHLDGMVRICSVTDAVGRMEFRRWNGDLMDAKSPSDFGERLRWIMPVLYYLKQTYASVK